MTTALELQSAVIGVLAAARDDFDDELLVTVLEGYDRDDLASIAAGLAGVALGLIHRHAEVTGRDPDSLCDRYLQHIGAGIAAKPPP